MADNKNENQQSQPMMVDPIAYRDDYNGGYDKYIEWWDWTKLNNADVNISQYWDDSSAKNYNNSELRWWENQKYTWENTKNSQVAYNKDATLEWLDPNYKYGQAAQMENSQNANYIARRNDEIASALYNAWKTSVEDVANFLSSQSGWDYSNENERQNTIQSVWKRLGQIASENDKSNDKQPESNNVKEEWNNEALNNMESDLNQSTAWKLYGKNTADENNIIKTLEDENSVYRSMNDARIRNLKSLQGMSSEKVAYLINDWVNTFSDQTMRDLMQYDPAKYQEIQSELKKLRWQNVIDQISNWWSIDLTQQLDNEVNNTNTSMNNFVNETADERNAEQLTANLSNALSQSEIINTARGQMEEYKRKMQDIQDAIDELPNLATKYFKSDVPQYMINAFISNRMQQYNKELQKYQSLYSATLDEAKLEISQAQWQEEMNYKWVNLQSDQNYKNANLELQRRKMSFDEQKLWYDMYMDSENNRIAMMKDWQWNEDGSYSYIDATSWRMITIPASQAQSQMNDIVASNADAFFEVWNKKLADAKASWWVCYWEQCEQFTDNYTEQFYWVRMEWDWHSWTTAEEKKWYVNVYAPSKWLVAVWNYYSWTENMKKYWHTWIVMDVDYKNWTFTYMASNNKWDGTVWVYTARINDVNLQGFRDPTQPPLNKQYDYYETPMTQTFEKAMNWARENGTEAERAAIQKAWDWYSLLYSLQENWYIDDIVNSDVLQNIISSIDASSFTKTDDNGSEFFEQLPTYIRNQVKDEDYAYGIYRLLRLIEQQLREESWAAINSSEWKWKFMRYLPQVWTSADFKRQNLRALETDTVYARIPYWSDAKKYYIEVIPSVENANKKKESDLEEIKNWIIEAIKQQNQGK